MKFECSICHKPGQEKVTTANCRPCHPAGESALHSHKDHGDCLVCHETHGWKTAATSCSTGACHPGEDESYHRANLEGFKGIRSHMSGLPR